MKQHLKSNVLAITPARGGSKGVPRKNIRLINGNPLLYYTIKSAKLCPEITSYIVNTEDEEIAEYAMSQGVYCQNRPKEFWYDNTFQEVDRLLCWSVREYEKQNPNIDIVVLLYATSPLRTTNTISECINLVKDGHYDSALSLTENRSYLWRKNNLSDSSVDPINYDPMKRGPNQLEGWNQWVENKAVYVVRKDLLLCNECRIGGKVGMVVMTKYESIDIDTEEDFEFAQYFLSKR